MSLGHKKGDLSAKLRGWDGILLFFMIIGVKKIIKIIKLQKNQVLKIIFLKKVKN